MNVKKISFSGSDKINVHFKDYNQILNISTKHYSNKNLNYFFKENRIDNFYSRLPFNLDYRQTRTQEQKDMDKVADFLSDYEKMLAQLKIIDAELTALAREKGMYDESKRQLNVLDEQAPYRDDKLLSGYLYQWALDNGFTTTKLGQTIKENEFLEMLVNGQLFKDKAFGGKFHGEWTHFLQWLCIGKSNKETAFLVTGPAQLYSWLGRQRPMVWFMGFEVPVDNQAATYDFRNVIKFNDFLLSKKAAAEIPVLHQLITKRADKRMLAQSALPKLRA